jgi:hypothetical protein
MSGGRRRTRLPANRTAVDLSAKLLITRRAYYAVRQASKVDVVHQQFPLARRVVDRGEHASAARQGRHSNPSPTRGDVETVG